MGSSAETIAQLNSARDIVLRDPAIYPQVVPGVQPVIGAAQPVDLRRWGADFLAEAFASPVVSAEDKGQLSVRVLETLRAYLLRPEETGEEEDATVLKSAVQCTASLYPILFRHTITTGDAEAWGMMMKVKSAILRRMDTAPAGVRICCIKFASRVVQVQTPGVIADPRRPEQNEVSLALVPREHALLVPGTLEAEASGLLDRLLSILQENVSDALIVTATLHALAPLVQRRASISTKILSAVLAFNPVPVAPKTPKAFVAAKAITRTTIAFLLNVCKRAPQQALLPRIHGHIDRLRQIASEIFTPSDQTNGLKRGPDEPIDGLHPNKRLQLDAEIDSRTTPQQQQQQQPDWQLPPGPVSIKDLWSLDPVASAAGFDVQTLGEELVTKFVPPLLRAVDPAKFEAALNTVRKRLLELERRHPPNAPDAAGRAGHEEEEDGEYDPNSLWGEGEGEQVPLQHQLSHNEVMQLPHDPPLSDEERAAYGEQARERLFGKLRELDGRKEKKAIEEVNGFSRSAMGGGREREGWITLLIRLATRSCFSLDEDTDEEDDNEVEVQVKKEKEDKALSKHRLAQASDSLPTKIRDALNRYIMDDWRRRLDVAIAWLNEEWYADRLASTTKNNNITTPRPSQVQSNNLPNYTPLTLSLFDQLLPYLDTKDGRHLIRFLSEIPYLPPPVFDRIRKIADDPERVQLSAQALMYLIMFRPPVRQNAIECAVRLWRENETARPAVEKVVKKWAPDVLVEEGSLKREEGE